MVVLDFFHQTDKTAIFQSTSARGIYTQKKSEKCYHKKILPTFPDLRTLLNLYKHYIPKVRGLSICFRVDLITTYMYIYNL